MWRSRRSHPELHRSRHQRDDGQGLVLTSHAFSRKVNANRWPPSSFGRDVRPSTASPGQYQPSAGNPLRSLIFVLEHKLQLFESKGGCVMNDHVGFGRPHTCIKCGAHFCCDDLHCDFAALSACVSCSNIAVPHSLINTANRVARHQSSALDGDFVRAHIFLKSGINTSEQITTW